MNATISQVPLPQVLLDIEPAWAQGRRRRKAGGMGNGWVEVNDGGVRNKCHDDEGR